MQLSVVPTPSALKPPLLPLPVPMQVPTDIADALNGAVRDGQDLARAWTAKHPNGSPEEFDQAASAAMGQPPTGADAQRDLERVRAAGAIRTPVATESAIYYQHFGGSDMWQPIIEQIGTSHGVDQAKRAARLVEESQHRTDAISDHLKVHFARQRPYQVDSSIEPVVKRPNGNPSFPSGHTSAAYAAALVLAHVVPERADEIMSLAAQVGWSRVYGGVHFPTDTVAGARLAAQIATDVLRRDAAV